MDPGMLHGPGAGVGSHLLWGCVAASLDKRRVKEAGRRNPCWRGQRCQPHGRGVPHRAPVLYRPSFFPLITTYLNSVKKEKENPGEETSGPQQPSAHISSDKEGNRRMTRPSPHQAPVLQLLLLFSTGRLHLGTRQCMKHIGSPQLPGPLLLSLPGSAAGIASQTPLPRRAKL